MSKNKNFILLIILLIMFTIQCTGKKSAFNKGIIKSNIIDSICISVNLPAERSCGFSILDRFHDPHFLRLVNTSKHDSIISIKYPLLHKTIILEYGMIIMEKPSRIIRHYYLVDKNHLNINLNFSNGNVLLENDSNIIVADDIYKSYADIRRKIYTAKSKEKKNYSRKLDSIHKIYNDKYSLNKELKYINKLHYIDKLQLIYPNSETVINFIEGINDIPVKCGIINKILYEYIKSRIETFKYNEINEKNYHPEFIRLFSLSLFSYLKFEDHIGDKKNEKAIEWLKTTDLYKNNSTKIDIDISSVDNKRFKSLLSNLSLISIDFKETTFAEIIKKNPSDYYLLDFWATWCAPCLDGIKRIENMNIPKNVKVINLSVDKNGVKDKWKRKAKETNQKISYLIKSRNKSNIEFQKFIKLESIPRYILIDMDMNVIDQAFKSPEESNFLFDLKHIKLLK